LTELQAIPVSASTLGRLWFIAPFSSYKYSCQTHLDMTSGLLCGPVNALCVLLIPVVTVASPNQHFLQGEGASGRRMSVHDVESRLSASFAATLSDQRSGPRLDHIEAAMWQTFQAVPKNSHGRLSAVASRHILRNYFAATHGWIINGLEQHAMNTNVTDVHQSTILLDRVPQLVEDLVLAKRAGHGLSLTDVVAMAAALEKLIFDETLELLKVAYAFNEQKASELVNQRQLFDILDSYMLLFEQGSAADLTDSDKHHRIVNKLLKQDTNWHSVRMYVQDTVKNMEYMQKDIRNPFVASVYSFARVVQLAEKLIQGYGRVQDAECRKMTQALAQLDPEGTGRIPLHVFYSQPPTADYQFTESGYYLDSVGAMDTGGVPSVRIANYVQGPSNCMAHTSYYSVCCLVACEELMRELEGSIRAPQETPQQLLLLVGNLSSPSIDAPRHLSPDLHSKMHTIAERHGGMVPLHGRLFAQWMHLAFPQECPFPHISADPELTRPSHWRRGGTAGKDLRVTPEDKKRLTEESASMSAGLPAGDALIMEWSEEEVLFLQEAPYRMFGGTLSTAMRLILQVSMGLAILRIGFESCRMVRPSAADKMCEITV